MFRVTFTDFGRSETFRFDTLSGVMSAIIRNPMTPFEVWATIDGESKLISEG